jgi:hypothetical protein
VSRTVNRDGERGPGGEQERLVEEWELVEWCVREKD